MIRPFLLLLAAATCLYGAESIRQPDSARFWLRVPQGDPPPSEVQVSSGTATAANWEKDPAAKNRVTDVTFPIRWWKWTKFTIRLTPVRDGEMEIILNGPWAADQNGQLFRQEILWDEIMATGATILNGGFEAMSPNGPVSWKTDQNSYPASDSWPLAGAAPFTGKHIAATWHNRPLNQSFRVKAGQPITIELRAMAATPPGFVGPARLGKNTPAHKAAAALKRGVNLGNCWEAPKPYAWGIRFTVEDIDRIADEGFDHIRVPVAWHQFMNSAGEIDPALLADLEPVLRRAIDRKLHVLLDWHHFYDLVDAPAANRERFVKGWESITRHFKDWPPELFLELLNEPNGTLTTEIVNPIHADAIAAIHRIDPQRIILVSPGNWGSISELEKLILPDKDDRIVVTVHCYEPFYFTHQKAGWVQLRDLQGITYPGPPQTPLVIPASLQENAGIRSFVERYNTLPSDLNPCSQKPIREMLDLARDWSDHFGRPVHLGEFGSHDAGDTASRARYLRDVRMLAESRGIPWTLWDWKATFAYWDSRRNASDFKDALFGK